MADASATSSKGLALAERLGWRAHRRPEPGFAHVLGAAAGAFTVLATVAVIVKITSDNPTAPGVLLSLALAVVAFAVGGMLPGPVRNAAVTALVLTVPLIWFFAFLGDGSGGRGDTRGIYLLSIACYFALYLIGWTRGRAVLLALALLFLAGWIIAEVGNGNGVAPFQQQIESQTNLNAGPLGSSGSSGTITSDNQSNDTTTTSVVAVVLGLSYLGAGAVLDRRKLGGAATPFIAVGAIFAVVGALALASDESALAGGLIATGVGAVVGLVGGLGTNRRGSTWIGVLIAFFGLVVVVADSASSELWFAGLAALVAAVLLAAGILLAPRLNEAVDGDDPAAAPG